MHQQLQKREEDNPGPGITKTTSNPWEKWSHSQKRGRKNTQETPAAPPKREKTQKRECIAEWHTILGLFLAQEVRTRFSKNGSLPNSKLVAHTLPLPCNNYLNHQQSFFNESGWVKTRRSHMGIFPYWLKLDNFPTSLTLEDHAPFDLVATAVAGCVHFN